jgi:hypothetical protein
MLWDGLILVMTVVLAVNGYKRGLFASWRGPIAMILATFAVQQFYIDFAAWVAARLRIAPEPAVMVGYLMLWFTIEIVLELVLGLLLKGGPQRRPGAFNRILGLTYGLCKALVIALLPLMAVSVELKIPQPPPDKSGLVVPQFAALEGSYLIPNLKNVAAAMVPLCGPLVVSTKAPSFKPDYSTPASAGGKEATKKDIEEVLK